MKLGFPALICLAPLLLGAMEVQPGDSASDVKAALGEPRGQAQIAERQLYYYDRGQIEFRNGVVARIDLLSPEAFAELRAQREAELARMRGLQALRAVRLQEEGEQLKASKLADPAFAAMTPARQVAFWEDFTRWYPGVPCAQELAAAHRRLSEQTKAERERAEQAARLAELEARVQQAEAEAAAARAYARNRDYYRTYGHSYAPRPFTVWPVDYRNVDLTTPWATPIPPMPENEYRFAPATQREMAREREGKPDREKGYRRDRRY